MVGDSKYHVPKQSSPLIHSGSERQNHSVTPYETTSLLSRREARDEYASVSFVFKISNFLVFGIDYLQSPEAESQVLLRIYYFLGLC